MSESINVLLVDDDLSVRQMICDYLEEQHFRVRAVADATAFRSAVGAELPDIVLLDVNLPGEDGLSLVRFLRERHDLPVLMISGAGSVVDRVVGLEVGADDYLVKPFEPRELVARIRTVLRRYRKKAAEPAQEKPRTVRLGQCVLDLDRRLLLNAQQEEIPLTAMEFDLLEVLLQRPNRPLSRDQLLNLTQNRDWSPYDRSIDIRITRLRHKLEADPDKPSLIKTVRGVGYMLALVPATSD